MRKYVDYLSLVCFHGLQKEFQFYCKKHRGISVRRNARNFLLKSGYYKELLQYRETGFNISWNDKLGDVIAIAKTPWLDE